MIKNEVNVEEVLNVDYVIKRNVEFSGKFNKTSRFILPLLDLNQGGKAMSMYLQGAFYDDHSIEHDFTKPVFVLFKVRNQKEKAWTEMYKLLSEKQSFIMDYYVGEQDGASLIMFVFDIPDKWANDYFLFKQGKYSKTSKEYKEKFTKVFYNSQGVAQEGKEWGILNKTDAIKNEVTKIFINPKTATPDEVRAFRKDMDDWDEVWDAPQPKEEIYHYSENSITSDTSAKF